MDRAVLYGQPATVPIQASIQSVPAGSILEVESGGIRRASTACMRSDTIDSAGAPGVTRRAAALPKS